MTLIIGRESARLKRLERFAPLSRLLDPPLDLLAKCGGKPFDGRELRVHLPGLEARHCGLRRPHARGHGGLRHAKFLALCREFSQQVPPAERGFDELGELLVARAAVVDDLVKEVVSVRHGPHYTVDGISSVRSTLAAPPPISEPFSASWIFSGGVFWVFLE